VESLVCVKRVPATDARIKIVPDGSGLDPSGVEYLLNPYDEYAVEEALKQKEKAGSGSVTAFCFGPQEAQKELKGVLAMGADSALLLKNPAAGDCDGATTARVLADAIRGRSFDLIFFGKQAVDRDQHGVGPMTATLLGIPCISEVVKLEVADGKVRAEREIEGGREIVEAPLPCAITCHKGLNEPRYATLKGIMAAKKKPLEQVEVEVADPAVTLLSMRLPDPKAPGRIVGEGPDAVAELVRALREEAKIL